MHSLYNIFTGTVPAYVHQQYKTGLTPTIYGTYVPVPYRCIGVNCEFDTLNVRVFIEIGSLLDCANLFMCRYRYRYVTEYNNSVICTVRRFTTRQYWPRQRDPGVPALFPAKCHFLHSTNHFNSVPCVRPNSSSDWSIGFCAS